MSHGQKRVRHSGRLLGRPNAIKCSRRPRQLKDSRSGHYYFISEATNFKVSNYRQTSVFGSSHASLSIQTIIYHTLFSDVVQQYSFSFLHVLIAYINLGRSLVLFLENFRDGCLIFEFYCICKGISKPNLGSQGEGILPPFNVCTIVPRAVLHDLFGVISKNKQQGQTDTNISCGKIPKGGKQGSILLRSTVLVFIYYFVHCCLLMVLFKKKS